MSQSSMSRMTKTVVPPVKRKRGLEGTHCSHAGPATEPPSCLICQLVYRNLYKDFFSFIFSHTTFDPEGISSELDLPSHTLMEYQKPFMKVDIKDALLVKPSKSPPSSILSLSTLDTRPDQDGLNQIVHVYRSGGSAIHSSDLGSKLDPVLVFKEALSKALVYYYPLAGRLVKHADGKLRVICSEEYGYGVPFIEAVANCSLSSVHYLDGNDTEIAKQLVFDLPSQDGHQYPLVFKLTKFLCGGFTIGIGMSHAVTDGFGTYQFFRAVIELARGRSEPSVKPVWERERLVGSKSITDQQPLPFPMDKASAAVSPFLPTTPLNLIQDCFKVKGEIIRRLKLSLVKESDHHKTVKESFTTFESLAAYVWRSRARALKQNNDGETMLNAAVGARRRLLDSSPLPDGYYGSALIDANTVLTVRELNEKPLYIIVRLIRKAKSEAFRSDYIRNFINSLEMGEMIDCSMDDKGAVMALSDWGQLRLSEDIDFGGNEAVNMVPAPCNLMISAATCIFMPPTKLDDPSMKGGVRIYTTLPIDAVPKFREEMEALQLILNPSKL